MNTSRPMVLVLQGSASDDPPMAGCFRTLEKLEIPYERRILSALSWASSLALDSANSPRI